MCRAAVWENLDTIKKVKAHLSEETSRELGLLHEYECNDFVDRMAKAAVDRCSLQQEKEEEEFLDKARRALRSTGAALAKERGPQFQKLMRIAASKKNKMRHEWRWTDNLGRWQCMFCMKTVTKRGVHSKVSAGACHRHRIPAGILDKGHDIHLYGEEGMEGTIMVCHTCGHYGKMRWAGLMEECKRQKSKQKGTLKWFAQGKHPKAPHGRLRRWGKARKSEGEYGPRHTANEDNKEKEETKGSGEMSQAALKVLEDLEQEAARALEHCEEESVFSFDE
jgi:hypothetical protein